MTEGKIPIVNRAAAASRQQEVRSKGWTQFGRRLDGAAVAAAQLWETPFLSGGGNYGSAGEGFNDTVSRIPRR
jgi:hypothetical protein